MSTLLAFLSALVRSVLVSRRDLALENAALRQQLAAYRRSKQRPRLRPSERAFWALLSRFWSKWKSPLVIVQPKTVIGWHKQGFKLFWRRKSRTRNVGRPRIAREHIALIKRISRENPGWGEDRIADELRLKLGRHSTGFGEQERASVGCRRVSGGNCRTIVRWRCVVRKRAHRAIRLRETQGRPDGRMPHHRLASTTDSSVSRCPTVILQDEQKGSPEEPTFVAPARSIGYYFRDASERLVAVSRRTGT